MSTASPIGCWRPQVACVHPCYVNETLMCSVFAATATVLALARTPNPGACFVHTQNSHQPRSSVAFSNSPSNRYRDLTECCLALSCMVSHRSGSSSVITGECTGTHCSPFLKEDNAVGFLLLYAVRSTSVVCCMLVSNRRDAHKVSCHHFKMYT